MESLTTELPEGDGGAVPAPGGEEDASLENPEGSKKRKRTRVIALVDQLKPSHCLFRTDLSCKQPCTVPPSIKQPRVPRRIKIGKSTSLKDATDTPMFC